MTPTVTLALDDHLEVRWAPGEDRPVAIEVSHDGEVVTRWETGSKPWDAGLLQVRNVVAANLEGYDREQVEALLEPHAATLEDEFAALFA